MTAEWENQQEQIRAMHMATQFLVTHQCTDEDARRIAEEMEASTPDEVEEISVDEQMAAANEEADSQVDALQRFS
jgi:predicted HAD superfamily phosphohydrolase